MRKLKSNHLKRGFIRTDVRYAVVTVDFRKQRNGLCLLVKGYLRDNPLQDRTLFAFVNKRHDSIKLLYWDGTGFALWTKTLEKDHFSWIKKDGNVKKKISAKELKWLLQGVDINVVKTHENVHFKDVC